VAKAKARRERSDSTDHALKVFATLQTGEFAPPAGCILRTTAQKRLWSSVIAGRAREEWRPHDLENAWTLMQLRIDLATELHSSRKDALWHLIGGRRSTPGIRSRPKWFVHHDWLMLRRSPSSP